jgi:hypothetical protein
MIENDQEGMILYKIGEGSNLSLALYMPVVCDS